MAGFPLSDEYADLANLQRGEWSFDYNQYLRVENERLRARVMELELGSEQEGERAYQRIHVLEKELRAVRVEKEVVSSQLKNVVSELGNMEQRLQADKDFVFGKQDSVSAQIMPCLQALMQLLHALDLVVKQLGAHHLMGHALNTLNLQIAQAIDSLQLLYKGSTDCQQVARMQQLQALGYALSVSTAADNNITQELAKLSQQLNSPNSTSSSMHAYSNQQAVALHHNMRGRSLNLEPISSATVSLRGLSPMSLQGLWDQQGVVGESGSMVLGSSVSEYSLNSLPESPASHKSEVHMEAARLQELVGPAMVVQCAWRAAWVRCRYNRLRREVFVGNLPIKEQVYEDELKESFSAAGPVETVAVMRNTTGSRGQVGLCRGFGFVRYYSVEDAYNALKMLQGVRFRSRTLRVDRATWRT